MGLGVGHDDDDAFVVLVSFTGKLSAESGHELNRFVDVVDGDIEMDPNSAQFRFIDWLEHEPGLRITATAELHPPVRGWPEIALK